MPAIKEVADFIGEIAPWELAEEWDNCGVLVQCGEAADKILVSLDITAEVAEEAESLGCGLVVSHHPVIFKPLQSIAAGSPVLALARRGISAICAHTNLDAADGGVNDVLAAKLALHNVQPMELGRLGCLQQPQTLQAFAGFCAQTLGGPVQLADAGGQVSVVAVIGGSGGSYWQQALAAGVDCLVTGEAGHHEALDATAAGLSIVAAGHFATEWPVVEDLAARLRSRFSGTEIFVSERSKAPFQIVL